MLNPKVKSSGERVIRGVVAGAMLGAGAVSAKQDQKRKAQDAERRGLLRRQDVYEAHIRKQVYLSRFADDDFSWVPEKFQEDLKCSYCLQQAYAAGMADRELMADGFMPMSEQSWDKNWSVYTHNPFIGFIEAHKEFRKDIQNPKWPAMSKWNLTLEGYKRFFPERFDENGQPIRK
mgnify:FL=1|jgi:hypothetical protein